MFAIDNSLCLVTKKYVSCVLKIKPVRDSMTEALQFWKKIAGRGDDSPKEQKASSHGKRISSFFFINMHFLLLIYCLSL